MSKTLTYRPEIDGLRALAVIPVIFFHAGFDLFSGGYVGVDVFFVISGYLITSIIISDKEAGNFLLFNFYERRIRRILPALIFVVLVCLPFSWYFMMPNQLADFSRSVFSVAVFLSNVLFSIQNGYFANLAEEIPLLHTWSLAVEEQFYVIFPLVFLLLWRFGTKWMVMTFLLIAVVSLYLAEDRVTISGADIYYLTHVRAWELLTGVLIALYLHKTEIKNSLITEGLGLIGVCMIVISVISFDKRTPFPGLYTLLPVAGAALIISFSHAGTYTARFLSAKMFVSIGLISYSAYLWHQPLFAFARLQSIEEPSIFKLLVICGTIFIFAYFTWRYIERPFRNRAQTSFVTVAIAAGTFSLAFVVLGLWGHFDRGKLWRTGTEGYPNLFAYVTEDVYSTRGNNGNRCHADYNSPVCIIGKGFSNKKAIMLAGDSHAGNFSRPFKEYLDANGLYGFQLTRGGCTFLKSENSHRCKNSRKKLMHHLDKNDVKILIFVANWSGYFHSLDMQKREKSIAEIAGLVKELSSRVDKLVIMSPRITMPYSLKVRGMASDFSFQDNTASLKSHMNKNGDIHSLLSSLKSGVIVFNQNDHVCDKNDICSSMKGAMPVYKDKNHYTVFGARLVFDELIKKEINRI